MKEPPTLKDTGWYESQYGYWRSNHVQLRQKARLWLRYLKQFQARDSGERQGVMSAEYFIKKFFNLEDK